MSKRQWSKEQKEKAERQRLIEIVEAEDKIIEESKEESKNLSNDYRKED